MLKEKITSSGLTGELSENLAFFLILKVTDDLSLGTFTPSAKSPYWLKGSSNDDFIKVSNRFDEHTADYSKDFLKIKELALKEKQLNAIQNWMNEKIVDTYISVNQDSRVCNFSNKWLKN